jgi:tetratricopeptide (TPR) repeat protein
MMSAVAAPTRRVKTSVAGPPLLRRIVDSFRGRSGRSSSRRSADPAVDLAGFLDDGERRDRQLVELREQAFGPDHPDVATALHILGARYHLVRRYEQAEALYDRVLSIRTETLGRDHPATVEVLEDLGDLWRDRADRFRAAHAYDQALSAVTDPARRNRKRQDYNARLALLDPTTLPG